VRRGHRARYRARRGKDAQRPVRAEVRARPAVNADRRGGCLMMR
jgi:hypothetical protein